MKRRDFLALLAVAPVTAAMGEGPEEPAASSRAGEDVSGVEGGPHPLALNGSHQRCSAADIHETLGYPGADAFWS